MINFTYTKLFKRIAPSAIAIAACLLLLSLAGLTNQHEWAVGWLRRRYDALEPLPFTLWMALERGGALIALSALAALMERIRRGASPAEQEQPQAKEETDSSEPPKTVQMLMSGVSSLAAVHFPLVYAVQLAVLVLLKLLGAGAGTTAAVAVCAGAAFVYQKKPKKKGGSRWFTTLQSAVGSVYIGYAFAHWAASSWLTALWTSAVLYDAPFLMMGILFISLLSMYRIRGAFKTALKHWIWVAAVAGATALWLWIGGSLEWTLEWTVGWLAGRYDGLAPWSFCWRIALEQTAVTIVLVLLIAPFESRIIPVKPDRGSKKKGDSGITLFHFHPTSVFVAPVAETLLFQALIIVPLRAMDADIGTQTVVSALLFFLAHCASAPAGNILASAPGGVYLGYAFAHWLPVSFWTALWVTILAHAFFNLLSDFWAVPAGVVVGLIKNRREKRKMRKESAETTEAERTPP